MGGEKMRTRMVKGGWAGVEWVGREKKGGGVGRKEEGREEGGREVVREIGDEE